MGDAIPIRTLGDYFRPSHEGYRNTIELPEGYNVLPLRSDTIRLLENQVQRLMKAHLAPMQPTQVNKITSSCEICSGPHETQYCMENPKQSFFEYAPSHTDEAGDEEKRKLFMELIEKRRKNFAELRAQEKRNRPPTKAHKRTQMSTYLKHMGGYKHKQLMGKSYDEIQKAGRWKILLCYDLRHKKAMKRRKRIEEDKETDEVKEVEEDDKLN
ncbi:hypothetical protein Tco_0873784 [Tanacetum coccineum]|uniref:MAK10-like protein n=1 Tax=Tanacetum coccineum TaxID=301880 RepID=A0ABQ5BNF1_9ASTR